MVLLFAACAKKETLKTETFQTKSGWGYSIAYKNKVIIKQSIIPVINDTKSFSTESDALKVADLVVKKLKQNISPTVTKNELILLKIKL
jgi:predicted glutamine amidotransferase